MKNLYFEVVYEIEDLEGCISKEVKECMKDELMRVYNLYAERANSGITDTLNEDFDHLYPTYFDDNEGKEWRDLIEYNKFMADGYQRLILDEFNKTNISPILNFSVDPKEVNLVGYLKINHDVKIQFFTKELNK